MRTKIEDYIKKCDTCQRNKHARHLPYGKMQEIDTPPIPWHTITMDFITKLPKSKDENGIEYDSIWTIVDKLTKYAYSLPFQESTSVDKMAKMFLRQVVATRGAPKKVITDRDPKFASKLWKSILSQLGSEAKVSTAFHKETDGQLEIYN